MSSGNHKEQPARRAPHFSWVDQYHERFLNAVESLGGAAGCTPSGVFQYLQNHQDGAIPGLQLRHVKSHLQTERHRSGVYPRQRSRVFGKGSPEESDISDSSGGAPAGRSGGNTARRRSQRRKRNRSSSGFSNEGDEDIENQDSDPDDPARDPDFQEVDNEDQAAAVENAVAPRRRSPTAAPATAPLPKASSKSTPGVSVTAARDDRSGAKEPSTKNTSSGARKEASGGDAHVHANGKAALDIIDAVAANLNHLREEHAKKEKALVELMQKHTYHQEQAIRCLGEVGQLQEHLLQSAQNIFIALQSASQIDPNHRQHQLVDGLISTDPSHVVKPQTQEATNSHVLALLQQVTAAAGQAGATRPRVGKPISPRGAAAMALLGAAVPPPGTVPGHVQALRGGASPISGAGHHARDPKKQAEADLLQHLLGMLQEGTHAGAAQAHAVPQQQQQKPQQQRHAFHAVHPTQPQPQQMGVPSSVADEARALADLLDLLGQKTGASGQGGHVQARGTPTLHPPPPQQPVSHHSQLIAPAGTLNAHGHSLPSICTSNIRTTAPPPRPVMLTPSNIIGQGHQLGASMDVDASQQQQQQQKQQKQQGGRGDLANNSFGGFNL